MISVKTSQLQKQVLKELRYSFGTIYIFDGFLISEINEGVHFSWEYHGKQMVEDISCFLGTDGRNIIYISNRIHSYSVVASDWLKFFKNYYFLKDYYVVEQDEQRKINSVIETMFFNGKIKRFHTLDSAVNFARQTIATSLAI